MTQPSLPTRNSGLRVFSASLLSALLIMMPFVQMAAASGRSSAIASRVPEKKQQVESKGQQSAAAVDKVFLNAPVPKPAPEPVAASISATLTDNIPAATTVAPGGTITYTATVTNSGATSPADDATSVVFQDVIDAHTTLVSGSLIAAVSDSYTAIGNVTMSIPDGSTDLLGNDFDPDTGNNAGMTVTAETKSSTNCTGGCTNNVTINANGSFTYEPPVGFTGTDTFTYTAISGTATATTTVRISVSSVAVWFIKNDAPACTSLASNCGTLAHPFSALANFQAVNDGGAGPPKHPKAGDVIFIYTGVGNYTGGITLLDNQFLIGQGATASIASIASLPTPSGTDQLPATGGANPIIVNAGGNDVSLTGITGNTIRGLTLGSSAAASFAISGVSFGTLTLNDLTINNGAGGGLNLSTGTLAATIASLTSTGAVSGVSLTTVSGTLNVNGGSVTVNSASNPAFFVTGGTLAGTYSGSLSQAGAAQTVRIVNHSTGTLLFQTGTISNAGIGLSFDNADGIYNFTGTYVLGGTTGIDIQNGSAGTFSFGANVDITNSSGTCFNVNGSTPGVTFSGDITKSGTSTGLLVAVTNQTSGTITFQTGVLSSTSTNGTGINLNNADGTVNFNGTNTFTGGNSHIDINTGSGGTFSFSSSTGITNPSGANFIVNGSNPNVTYSGNLTKDNVANTAGALVSITNQSGGTITFQTGTLSSTSTSATATGTQLSNADGTVNFNGTTTLNGGDAGIDILTGSGGTIAFSSSLGITNPTGPAVFVSASSGGITIPGSLSKSTDGKLVDFDNYDTGTATISATLSCTSLCDGVEVTNDATASGTVNFSGTTKTLNTGASPAVNLDNNDNGFVNFTGGSLDIDTTSGTGFNAINGGTITVTGTSNSIFANGSGTALNVVGTTIGAADLTFQSISAGTGAGTAGAGIILDNTGASGNLVVTGNGGTCTSADQTGCSGGVIQHKTGANITDTNLPAGITGTTGTGIFLRDTRDVSLTRMHIHDFDNYAIFGSVVTNFTLANSVINGVNGNDPNVKDAAFAFQNLTGSASISSTVIQGGVGDNVRVVNNTGTLDRIVFSNFTEGPMDLGNVNGNDGMLIQAQANATIKLSVLDSTLTSARGDILQFDLQGGAGSGAGFPVGDLIFRRNTVNNTHPFVSVGGGGLTLSGGGFASSSPTMTYDIGGGAAGGNTFRGARGDALLILFQTGAGTATGRIENNTFGVTGVNSSCSREAACIEVRSEGRAGQTALINNNTIQQYGGHGVYVEFDGINTAGSTGTIGAMNVTFTNNTVREPVGINSDGAATGSSSGIQFNFGATIGDTYQGCADVLNNTANNAGDEGGSNGRDYAMRQRNSTTLRMPGYTGDDGLPGVGTAIADVTAYIQGRNTSGASSSVFVATPSGGGGYLNTSPAGSACLQPPAAVVALAPSRVDDDARTATSIANATAESSVITATSATATTTDTAAAIQQTAIARLSNAMIQNAATASAVIDAGANEVPGQSEVRSHHAATDEISKKSEGYRGEQSADQGHIATSNNATTSHALAVVSGETVTVNIGTLPAGGTVTIGYQVTVNNPPNLTLLTPPRVTTQGSVTGNGPGPINVSTDDPEPAGGSDPTVTLIDLFDTSTSVTCAPDPSSTGQQVTCTATVAENPVQGGADPNGTVDFIDTSNGNAVICNDVPVSGGTAQCQTTSLTAGVHNIRADYNGDVAPANFEGSQSATYPQDVIACVNNPVVTKIADTNDGVCDADCSLREAIDQVCNGGTITFNTAGVFATPQTIVLSASFGALTIDESLTINGPGAAQQVTVQGSGNASHRVFIVNSGKTATIANLKMTGGNSDAIGGGGIKNDGTLTLKNSTVSGNNTTQNGGGIFNSSVLNIVNSTISGNGSSIDGGGLVQDGATPSLTMINTTVSGNTANGFAGGLDLRNGTATIINATITGNHSDNDNTAGGGAGGIRQQTATVTLNNTIVAGNYAGSGTTTPNDIEGTVTGSNNLIGNAATAGGLTHGTNANIVGNAGSGTIDIATVLVTTLAANGGATLTHALVSTGPAVEAGSNALLPTDTFDTDGDANVAETLPVDQRGVGFPRNADSADANTTQTVDIGAFELHPSVEDITDKTTAEDTATNFNFTIGDDGIGLITSVVATSSNTTLVPDANLVETDGTANDGVWNLAITPAANANSPADGTATITVTVTASNGRTATDTFVVTVTEVNDAPVPTNDTIADIGEDCSSGCTGSVYVIPFATLLANDTNKGAANESGQTLTITNVSAPTGGTVAINGTNVEFTPTADFSGAAGFTYTATDNGTTNTVLDAKSGNALVSFNITNTNDNPTLATNTGITVNEGSTGNIITSAMLSVTDPDNTASQIVFTVGTAPANGTLRKSGGALAGGSTFTQADINGSLITYDHNGGETTSDSFTFTVSDGAGGSIGLTTFNITITPVNDAPVVTTTVANLAYNENDPATVVDSGVTITDVDSANLASATVSITTNFQSGQDVLSWTDNNVGDNITLSGASTAQTIILTGSDTLANYQAAVRAVTYQNTSDNPSTVTRTVTFSANDGTDTGSGTRGITVAAANDNPTIANNTGITVTEGSTGNIITSAMLSVTDPDNTAAQLTYTVGTAPANGTLRKSGGALAGGGTFTQADIDSNLITYDHDGSNTTSDSFTFTVSDGVGGSIGLTTFNITVTAANDAPAITAGGTLNYTENDPATAIDTTITVSDGDSPNLASATVQITGNYVNGEDVLSFTDTATITGVFTAASGTLTLTGADTPANYQAALRSVRYNNTSETPSTLARTVSWTVNDGSSPSNIATSTINVSAANDAPVNTVPGGQGTPSNTPLTFSSGNGNQVSVADVDAGAADIRITLTATNGTMTLSTTAGLNFACGVCAGDGTADATMTFEGTLTEVNTAMNGMTFTPTLGFSGPATLTITSNDLGNTGSGGAQSDTDVVNIQVATEIRINDASSIEPASPNTIDMVFTVSLNSPAPAGGVSVNFSTQDEPAGIGKAVAGICGSGGDYVATNGSVTFAVGQQVKTINVPICSDAASEPDETFKVLLFGETGGTLIDGDATGTIKSTNTAGTVLISELRTSGPSGAGDDFVEIYNNTNSPLTVAASDASAGYGLYKMGADCNATPVLIGVIPNGTVIPARGHYLFVGSAYSLTNYGGTGAAAGNLTLSFDIETDANVGLFSTSNVAGISSVNRLDAVGFGTNTGGACNLLREGSTLPAIAGNATLQHSYFRKMCEWIQGQGCTVPGIPKDTNINADDFWLADTAGSVITGRLGAPGPENLASPIRRDNANNPGSGGIDVFLLDGTVGSAASPNRARNGLDPAGTFGSMIMRYRVVNNTGGNVTRLRYRIVDISTAIQPVGPVADLRALSSSVEPTVGPVNDSVTCTAGGAGAPPCTVNVTATTLETPPAQAIGGGYNSTLSSGTITTGTPLGNGNSILINFKLGVEKTGAFRFYIIVEALP